MQEKREEKLGASLLEQIQRVQRKAWELLDKMEAEGDSHGSLVALREVRECMESHGEMLAKAEALKPATGANCLCESFTSERVRTMDRRVKDDRLSFSRQDLFD